MAVVTLKYLTNRNHLKAHLRYITHRRTNAQEKITRPLFTKDGLTDKKAVYELIDTAPRGTLFYKIMISPDPNREDTHKDLDLSQLPALVEDPIERGGERQEPDVSWRLSPDLTRRRTPAAYPNGFRR